MTPIAAILDTGAGTNFTSKGSLRLEWYTRIKPVQDTGLAAARKQFVEV